jgi:low temperature requirement protein LtrA
MRTEVWRRPGAERVVTPLELFFDLVYVFAIGELSHHLLEHVDVRTGLETTVLTFAVVYAWYMTAWGANWLEPDRLPVRLMLIALMFASLLMSAGIGEAFGDRALADSDTRVWLWAIAVLLSYGGVQVLHWLPGRGQWVDLQHTEISGSHLLERLRLFFLIALGETVLTMGTAFTGEPFALERLAALAISFTGSVAIWWCYFQAIEGSITHAAEEADDAGTIGWWGTLTLTLGVLALIAIAVGNEMAIAHPDDDATLGFAILAFGGPALFLLAQLVLLRESLGQVPRSRVLGALALGVLAVLVAAAPASMIAGIAAAAAALVAVAVSDSVTAVAEAGSGERQLRH